MPPGHAIHRLHEFVPHLAERQPGLLAMLPPEERPAAGLPLADWVWCLPQKRLMEICSAWVLESVRSLATTTPLGAVLIRGALHFAGEFDVADAGAVSLGIVPPPGDPRREEIRTGLLRAARLGVLIHLPATGRFCIPFPVRLSFEGIDYLDPSEAAGIKRRMVRHFAAIVADPHAEEELGSPRHWRFANLLAAYEMAVELADGAAAADEDEILWARGLGPRRGIDHPLAEALARFGSALGRAMVQVQSGSGARLIGASVAAVRQLGRVGAEADGWGVLGQYHLRRKEFSAAIHAFRMGEAIRAATGDQRGAVVCISAVAMALRAMGSRELAAKEFLRACELARETGLREQEIDTANCAAGLLAALDRDFEAIRVARAVLDGGSASPRVFPACSELLVHMGAALRRSGHPEEARASLFEALELSRSVVHRPAEARSCLEIGRLMHEAGQKAEAGVWLRRARSLFVETQDSSGVAECHLALFRALPPDAEDALGEEHLQKALRSADAAGDHALMASIWHERAALAIRREDPGAAVVFVQNRIQALRKASDPTALVQAHLALAALYLECASPVPAMADILRAQAIARRHALPEAMVSVTAALQEALPLMEDGQFDYLVDRVTEELESGEFGLG